MSLASRVLPFALVSIALLSSCVSRRVDVVPFLPPTSTASLEELVERINEWRSIDSLVLRVDLQFETVDRAEEGEGRQFRTAQGRLLLSRPGRIRLNIEAPILSANIAEMASDGERFQLLIHPPEYRAMIHGRNDESYREQTEKLDEDPELEKAGPLVNIRPQHLTDAFLIAPIPVETPHTVAFLTEERVEEPDTRTGAKKDALVRKSYHVVTALRLGRDAPSSRYWFDRGHEPKLRRQQVYGADGRLMADIRYDRYRPGPGPDPIPMASRVRIERPYDDYALVVTVKPDGVTVNRELPDRAFLVEAPEAWGDDLRVIDLDDRTKGPE